MVLFGKVWSEGGVYFKGGGLYVIWCRVYEIICFFFFRYLSFMSEIGI